MSPLLCPIKVSGNCFSLGILSSLLRSRSGFGGCQCHWCLTSQVNWWGCESTSHLSGGDIGHLWPAAGRAASTCWATTFLSKAQAVWTFLPLEYSHGPLNLSTSTQWRFLPFQMNLSDLDQLTMTAESLARKTQSKAAEFCLDVSLFFQSACLDGFLTVELVSF